MGGSSRIRLYGTSTLVPQSDYWINSRKRTEMQNGEVTSTVSQGSGAPRMTNNGVTKLCRYKLTPFLIDFFMEG